MKQIILEMLEILREDIKSRAYLLSGEEKEEALARLERLRKISQELRMLHRDAL